MRNSILVRVAFVVALALAVASPALAQSSSPFKIVGTISDYTDAANAAGPWNITGDWSAELRGRSGRVDFIVSLAMVRSTTGAASHTHHVALLDATVTRIANGYRHFGRRRDHQQRQPGPVLRLTSHRGRHWRQRRAVLERQADLRRSGGRALRGPADRGRGDASALNPTRKAPRLRPRPVRSGRAAAPRKSSGTRSGGRIGRVSPVSATHSQLIYDALKGCGIRLDVGAAGNVARPPDPAWPRTIRR